jgi:hypothetical protein
MGSEEGRSGLTDDYGEGKRPTHRNESEDVEGHMNVDRPGFDPERPGFDPERPGFDPERPGLEPERPGKRPTH